VVRGGPALGGLANVDRRVFLLVEAAETVVGVVGGALIIGGSSLREKKRDVTDFCAIRK